MLIVLIILLLLPALFSIAVYMIIIRFIRPARRPSPLGHVLILTLIIVIVYFVAFQTAVEWKGRSRESQLSTICRNNLKQIYLALMVYAQDNDGWLPPKLITVLGPEDEHKTARFCPLFCPAAHIKDRRAPELEVQYPDKVTAATIDYQYVTGLRDDGPPGTVVCKEKSATNHKIGRHILYLNGHIEARKP
jgi:hypothetical protein